MSKPGKLLVGRGVDHGFLAGGWRRIDVSSVTAQEVARLYNGVGGEIFCVRGSWSWKTGDELAYMQRALKEIGVNYAERRVVERKASDVIFDCGDHMVVIENDLEKPGDVAFTLYVVEPRGAAPCEGKRVAPPRRVAT